MNYGYFDDAAREYVITNPRTPTKWINYIGTLQFGGYVDHTGGALLCARDPALNRITKYISQMPDGEFKGETMYLRVRAKGGQRVYSPFFVPTLLPLDHFECSVVAMVTFMERDRDPKSHGERIHVRWDPVQGVWKPAK